MTSNIDRYWAIWQAMHPEPENWFPKNKPGATTKPEGEKELQPFYKTRTGPGQGTFWTSDQTKDTATFGYIYDDMIGFKDKDKFWKQYRDKYIWSVRLPNRPDFEEIHPDMKPFEFDSSAFSVKSLSRGSTFSALASATASVSLMASEVVTSSMMAAPEPILLQAAPAVEHLPVEKEFNREWYVDTKVAR